MAARNLIAALSALVIAVFLLCNARALYEGIFFYLRHAIFSPLANENQASVSLERSGKFSSLYDLVSQRNKERFEYLHARLESLNVSLTLIPIPDYPYPNLFVRFEPEGPYTIFSAHYDKLYDRADYQGASDNTAAVSVLLASAAEFARSGSGKKRALLFTGGEETGFLGAKAFVQYARENKLAIREIVNFDNLGRGKLAIRPSAQVPGFVFTIPFVGDVAFDGRGFKPSPPYPRANVRLTQALLQVQPEITVLERFTAVSDSNVFEASGIDTASISGDDFRHLEQTWHTFADRVELLEESNLNLAFDLIIKYGQ